MTFIGDTQPLHHVPPTYVPDKRAVALKWVKIALFILLIGAVGAVGYYSGLAWHHGLDVLHSKQLGISIFIALKIGALLASAYTYDSIYHLAKEETLKKQLAAEGSSMHIEVVQSLSDSAFSTLLNQAHSNDNLATRLSLHPSRLITHLGTAEPKAIQACLQKFKFGAAEPFMQALQKIQLSTIPKGQHARLKENLNNILTSLADATTKENCELVRQLIATIH